MMDEAQTANPAAPEPSQTPTPKPPAPPGPPNRAATPPVRKPRRPRPKALINENGCTGCEECITVCPVDCIVKVPNPALPEINPICRVDWDRCTGCTICVRDCPWETIEMVFPNAPDLGEKIEAFSLTEYGTQYIPTAEPDQPA